jgi:hypothetical protein
MSAGPKLAFYHDSRHPLIYMYEPPMSRSQHEAAVDELLGTPVDALMFCLGDGRTMLHDTKVGELWGHNVDRWPHLVFRRAHLNATDVIATGTDPLRIVCERARAKALAIYPSLILQQGRGPRDVDVRCSEFRFDNKHLELGPETDAETDANDPASTLLDFSHETVRDERFALVKEVVESYPVSGFELHFAWYARFFKADGVDAGRELMTHWVRDISELVRGSGSSRQLAIRVPVSIEGCYQAGLDVAAWMSEGLVDIVTGQTFPGAELVDCTADFGGLVKAARGTDTHVLATVNSFVDSDRMGEATIEVVRACASNMWAQGVDGLYLAHWFGLWPYEADFYQKLRELPHPEVMAPKDKQYYLPTSTHRQVDPNPGPGGRRDLPLTLVLDEPSVVVLLIADDLPKQPENVREVLLRLRLMNWTEADVCEIELNGQRLPEEQLRRINETYRMAQPRFRAGPAYWFVYRLGPDLWPRLGGNTISIRLTDRAADVIPPVILRDVECEIRYLRGRAAHRGFVDPDLGAWTSENP